jgi:hypothetical protein
MQTILYVSIKQQIGFITPSYGTKPYFKGFFQIQLSAEHYAEDVARLYLTSS